MVNLFQKRVPINKIKLEDIALGRRDLTVARSRSRASLGKLERDKSEQWTKAVKETSKDIRASFLGEISTIGVKIKLERSSMQSIEKQLRMLSVAEAVKGMEKRRVQSPVLRQLANAPLLDLEDTVQDILGDALVADEVTNEIVGMLGFGMNIESDPEISDLERIIEQAQAAYGPEADTEMIAQRANEEHNRLLESSSESQI